MTDQIIDVTAFGGHMSVRALVRRLYTLGRAGQIRSLRVGDGWVQIQGQGMAARTATCYLDETQPYDGRDHDIWSLDGDWHPQHPTMATGPVIDWH